MLTARHRNVITGLVSVATAVTAMSACTSSSKDNAAGNTSRSGGASNSAASSSAVSSASSSRSPAPAAKRTVAVVLTAQGCQAEHTSYASGPLTFSVKNTDATGVSEFEVLSNDRILGEKENLAPGFGGSFSLELQPGKYTMYCPGADSEKAALSITGTATTSSNTSTRALLQTGAEGYLGYVRAQVDTLQQRVAALNTALKGTNLKAAQLAYIKARAPYERIEPVAESFPNLDPLIDERADDKAATKLTGFHRIEYGLFTTKSLTGLAPVGAGLVANVARLKKLTAALTGFQPAELANGAVGLLDEAAKSKITGEEGRYSHIDLLDFSANLEGAQQAFAYLEDGLAKIDPALVARIKAAFVTVATQLSAFKDPGDPSGYQRYPALTKANLTTISHSLQSVAEPLSKVAGKVVSA